MNEIKVRASKADLAWRCSMSVADDGVDRVSEAGEGAEMGSAFHAWAEHLGERDRPSVEFVASIYGVDVDELRMLCSTASKMWDERLGEHASEQSVVEGEFEVTHNGVRFSATLDRLDPMGADAVSLDWKTGHGEAGYDRQMMQQAFVAAVRWGFERVTVRLAFVRNRAVVEETFNRAELRLWADAFADRLKKSAGVFRPGVEWCWKCDREANCPAARDHARTAITRLHEFEIEALTPENAETVGPILAANLERVKQARKICEAYERAVRDEVSKLGRCPAGNGNELVVETRTRKTWNALVTVPLLIDAVGVERAGEACTVSRSKALAAVRANAERGEKKSAAERFEARVAAEGGEKASEYEVLETRKMEVQNA